MASKRDIKVNKKVGVSSLGKSNMIPPHGHGSNPGGGANIKKHEGSMGVNGIGTRSVK